LRVSEPYEEDGKDSSIEETLEEVLRASVRIYPIGLCEIASKGNLENQYESPLG